MKICLKLFVTAVLIRFLVAPDTVPADETAAPLPSIERLDIRDVIFKQFLNDVEQGRKAARAPYYAENGTGAESRAETVARHLTLYSYSPSPDDNFFRLAARCSVPYDAIATLNRLSSVPDFQSANVRDALILPSLPGIFIPENPESDLEKLILSSRGDGAGAAITINTQSGKQRFRFIPGDSLTPNERAFFLNPGKFRFPLQKFTVTSGFGQRISPISGRRSVHNGLDLAAPSGTEVYAAGDGAVIEVSQNPVYGNYIVIRHDNGWTSLYGHLSSVKAGLQSYVTSGTLIGYVGSTGLSTGPHLHFELRQNGEAQNPAKFLGGVPDRQ
ncbi:MAG: M23 family metallopeptidase [Spirochaetaceae bacterium]|nr:M23 family metallopeptidase [Spirochaetaceae bacterium]